MSILRGYRKLRALLIRRTGSEHSRNGPFKILELPLDIIRLILDELPGYDLFLLSQTCGVMRSLLQPTLTRQGRLGLLTQISDVSLGNVFCLHCHRIHSIDPSDVPYPPERYRRHRRFDHSGNQSLDIGFDYTLKHHHVRLAVQYFKAGWFDHPYYRKLVAPFSVAYHDAEPLPISLFVQPKIANNRFLLFTRRQYGGVRHLSIDSINVIKICPHRVYVQSTLPSLVPNPLIDMVHRAFSDPGMEIHSTCSQCPTDYMVVVYDGRLVVDGWQDLGRGGCALDFEWLIHIDGENNHQFNSPVISHVPGAVRNMYSK